MRPSCPTRPTYAILLTVAALGLTACTDLLPLPLPATPEPAPIINVPTFPDDPTDPTDPVPDAEFTLLAVTPDTDDITGGLDVMLTGTGFRDGLEVVFGESVALDVFVASHTTAIVTVPPHPAGRVDLSVWHPDLDGGLPRVLPAAFRYRADLAISAIDPAAGGRDGGEPITVRGTGFTLGTRFFIGGRPAIRQARVDDTTLTGIAPPGAAGPADVQVIGDNGVFELERAYQYREPPRIDAVTPVVGAASGGDTVRLEGAGLDADAQIRFAPMGAEAAPALPARLLAAAADGRWIEVEAPAGPPGGVADLQVVTGWGATRASAAWTWADSGADPQVLACTTFFPRSGPSAGNASVTLACRGLGYGATVSFGDQVAEALSVDPTGGHMTVRAPAGTGEVPVTVTSPFASVTFDSPYAYEQAPTVAVFSVSPATGPPEGGTPITILGAGFSPGAQVSIGALPAASVVVIDDTTLTAVTPPGAPGLADVVVRQSGLEARLMGAFDFVSPTLELALVSPPNAAQSGGTWLRVYGSGFDAAAEVTIGGAPCPIEARVSSAEIHVRSPKLPVGTYDVSVTAHGRVATLAEAFTVFDPRSGYGGTWGASIDETLNVTVWGSGGYGPIPGAFVIVGPEATSALTGYTDENGQLTLSTPGFHGPVEVTATKQGFSNYSVVRFDASNLTVYLRQDPVPVTPNPGDGTANPGPPPNATLRGRVLGLDKYVVAPPGECDAVAISGTQHCASCSPEIGCVGEDGVSADGFACVDLDLQGHRCAASCSVDVDCPTGYACGATIAGPRCLPSPGERIAYCNVTTTSLFGYEYPIQETAWVTPGQEYELDSRRLGDMAVYCFGGYRTVDGAFTPTAFGVARHVFPISGAVQTGIDVELTHPLRRTFRLKLQDPPTWPTGVFPPQVVISLDLGGDGVVPFSRTLLDAGDDLWLAPHQLAALSGDVYDADYFFYTTLQANVSGAYPRSYNLVQYVTRVVEDRLPVHTDEGWRLEGTQLERDLNGVYGAPNGQAYAVGEDGLILGLFNGHWTEQTSQTDRTLRAVAGRDAQDVWAVGDRGTVRHWDGLAWQAVDAPIDDYRAVAVASDRPEVYAAGAIRVRSLVEGSWSVAGPPWVQQVHGLALTSAGDLAAVGASGRVYLRDAAGTWSQVHGVDGAGVPTLRAVHIDAVTGTWTVVGDEGTILVGQPAGGLARVPLATTTDLTALAGLADGGLVIVGDDGVVVWQRPDGSWEEATIADYRSRATGVIAPPGGPLRVVGSAAFILGPFLHFPIITAPVHDAALTDMTLAWTWTGGPDNEYSRLLLYPEASATYWELVVDGKVTSVALPDIRAAAGFDALGHGRLRFEVTRILHPNFDIDAFSTRDFSIYLRESWSTHQSTFYVP